MQKNKSIVAGLIEQGTLEKGSKNSEKSYYKLDKVFFKTLLENLEKSKIISSTGYNSREIMHIRKKYHLKNLKIFIW